MVQATTSDGFLLGLESHMRRTGQGPHLAATILEFDGLVEPAALNIAADALGRRHPLLHARLRRSPLTFVASWHPGPATGIEVIEHEGEDLHELAARLLNTSSIDIFKDGPNLEIHHLRQDDISALILIWPHSLFDAIGIDKLIGELESTDAEPRKDWGETNPVTGAPSELWKAAHPMIEEMRTFPAANIHSLHQPARRPGKARFEVLAFDKEGSAAIQQRLSEVAGELLMIPYFAAICARAVAALLRERGGEPGSILVSLPIQRVANPDKRPLFQNHMAAWSLLLAADSLGDAATATKALYRSYASFMKRKLPAAMEALTKLNERCPSRLYLLPIKHYLKGEICSMFHSHTGKLAEHTESLFGRKLTNAYHMPSVSTPPGIGIFFSERNQRLTCTLSWRDGSLTESELVTLRQQLLADLGTSAPT